MTKREKLQALLEGTLSREDIVAYCEHELQLLDNKKASSTSKSKVTQEEVDMVYNALAKYPDGLQIKTLIENELGGTNLTTSSKVYPRLKPLMESGKVVNEKIKGISYYKVVA